MPSYAEAASRPRGSDSSGVHSDLSMYRGSPPSSRRDRKYEIQGKIQEEEEKIKNLQELLGELYSLLSYTRNDAIEFETDFYDDGTHLLHKLEDQYLEEIWYAEEDLKSIEDSIEVLKTELWNI